MVSFALAMLIALNACGRVDRAAIGAGLSASNADARTKPAMVLLADVPLPGKPGRFDYQSFDERSARLYIAEMGAGGVIAFDTRTRRVVARAGGLPKATGVLAIPDLHRVYVSVAGAHRVAILDGLTLRTIGSVEGITFPDGLAYAAGGGKVFVSDEFGRREIVIDAATNRMRAAIPLGGEAGNTQYDSAGRQILVAVQTRNELVTIEPISERITGHYHLAGADRPHGVLVDASRRIAFVANEGNDKLLVVDLKTMGVISEQAVGREPDVLTFDPTLRRLYVASESGAVTVFGAREKRLEYLGTYTAPQAHSVAVNSTTHEIYLPLADVGGRPVLRILALGQTR